MSVKFIIYPTTANTVNNPSGKSVKVITPFVTEEQLSLFQRFLNLFN